MGRAWVCVWYPRCARPLFADRLSGVPYCETPHSASSCKLRSAATPGSATANRAAGEIRKYTACLRIYIDISLRSLMRRWTEPTTPRLTGSRRPFVQSGLRERSSNRSPISSEECRASVSGDCRFWGSDIMSAKRVEDFGFPYEFLIRSGRAVMIPAYWGTLERGPSAFGLPDERRGRPCDKVVSGPGQVCRLPPNPRGHRHHETRLLRHQWGAAHAPRLLAVDTRFKAAALLSGGLLPVSTP